VVAVVVSHDPAVSDRSHEEQPARVIVSDDVSVRVVPRIAMQKRGALPLRGSQCDGDPTISSSTAGARHALPEEDEGMVAPPPMRDQSRSGLRNSVLTSE